MRLFPSAVHKFNSDAERKVFELLRATDLGPNAFAFHSLNLSKHEYKQWTEIDFLVVWDEGAYALEVKGGRVACRDGIWTFTNRFNEEHKKSEGPFEQAKSGHYALRKAIDQHPDRPSCRGICWGWGVVFPDIDFDVASVSWSPALIANHPDLSGRQEFARFLRQLAKFWRSQGKGHRTLANASELRALKNALRPDFDKVPSIAVSIDNALDAIVRLTDEQISMLDSIDENDRIFCTGGAGTGKSFLALESARRESAEGRKTLLLCRSPIFAAFLRSRVRGENLTVTDFASLPGNPDNQSLFDVLIVDEAQDLLTEESLSQMERLLTGGLSDGRWRMFLDVNNQSGLHEAIDPVAVERLRRLAAKHHLKRNCRNTEQIVLQTQLVTGADIGVAVIEGQGPPIEIVDVDGEQDTAKALQNQIIEWLDNGVRPGHMSILSPLGIKTSVARLLEPRLRSQITVVDAKVAAGWPATTITFSTIRDFKGLENRCIAVVDLAQFDETTKNIATLYVAMTRANAGLWIAVPKSQRPVLDGLITDHTRRMLSQGDRK